ncbi:SDR family NAD(P)-dependent oxidoreductase [Marinomonas sp. A79]|uniref:SDR family NAD(P)-dependent oxidoreductase n=1 Tax=Marinomonas vulgaris TaxID=2823372 RepID=A0ABS5HBM5_9GAMM|nr:SDR family NAD(P)-dependent oxidoreductase [Marinomonas vulgaris]MBR7889061.1 SDR family NAD(P)-dependent oxidoreductase [Marinomonas vulgaris]
MSDFYALVIGASSKISHAAIAQFEQNDACLGVFAVSRTAPVESFDPKTHWFECDYSETAIRQVCKGLMPFAGKITKVLICNGILHEDSMMPERKLEDVTAAQLERTFQVNTIIPMLWLSHILPLVKGETSAQISVFSARIGSISDNKTGGWYSYRASKAALNMLIQTCSIEYARRAKNVKLIAFHPGTTDTPLSKPFQRSVPEGKLFTPEFVATQLLFIMDDVEMNNKATYLDWNNQAITW